MCRVCGARGWEGGGGVCCFDERFERRGGDV